MWIGSEEVRKVLVVLLIVVVGMLVVADFGARAAVENQLEHRLEHDVPGPSSASVTIDSFPFLGRLLVTGQLSTLHAEVSNIEAGPLRLSKVTVDLHDVHINREALL